MEILSLLLVLVGAVIQIILIYKVWKMTDDVKEILLIFKGKENRELGLPRKARLKSSGKEVTAFCVENGQILCVVSEGGTEYSEDYEFEDVEFL